MTAPTSTVQKLKKSPCQRRAVHMREIEPYKPRVLKTSLSDEAEQRIKAELSKAA